MSALRFELPAALSATVPPEVRGVPRDGVRLLVADGQGLRHRAFHEIGEVLRPGDLLVVNTSATLPAAVDGTLDGRPVTVHLSTRRDDGTWLVEVRPPGRATGPLGGDLAGARVDLPGPAALHLGAPHGRLWQAAVTARGGAEEVMRRHGRPVSYAYVEGRWPLSAYQTAFARVPGSAEMPSAARPFTPELVTELVADGVAVAPVVLHCGVSSLEEGEGALPERYAVPPATARLVATTRAAGGRVVAVGTTVVRALETAAAGTGTVAPSAGWTDLVLGPDRPARVVDGLVTGWHAPGASHLSLLEAVVGPERVAAAYASALREGYLWHEFGDSALLLR
ncbi:S-adenosylmethionine:tRNA ribosyltransferase-isomerase [Vallicoccus soli]|uniref:S-adenosylmethionine:tRNA ribosyltransferase-isomerase n=1 Tax=Vallicoccus soli TaxID=2339232 RepID=A0A3A3ZMA1_9ACTN|nr:S-adenosylmethionine:tRNA ribosyltransferase-isomerase [Vallicoccus soli]RJK97701.1 S-adenosylmethionine:tRNA ribosyltransferase-isomerase [Vallicoccus soli]